MGEAREGGILEASNLDNAAAEPHTDLENETMNDYEAYSLRSMTRDLRTGIWSELYTGRKIDTYRRNLQRAHIDRLAYLMTAKNQSKRRGSDYVKSTAVNTSQSDIRAIVRSELKTLKNLIISSISNTSNSMNKIHLRDAIRCFGVGPLWQ